VDLYEAHLQFFFFGKLTYVLKEEDTNIIRGIPQIYNDKAHLQLAQINNNNLKTKQKIIKIQKLSC
jgi:hypothetical protein